MTQFPKIRFGVLCEDVRREDNGKLFFLGVFGESVLVSGFPASLTFANPVWFALDEPFDGFVWSQVLLDDTKIAGVKGVARIPPGQPLMSIQPIPLQVPKEGVLSFQLKFSEESEWQTALSIPIRLSPSARASQPPSGTPT